MRLLAAIAILAALWMRECGPADPGPPPGVRGAELMVREARAAQPLYFEGSFGYLRIVRLDSGIVVRKGRARTADPGTRALFRASCHRRATASSPTSARATNCGCLDGPTERCDVTVTIRDGRPRTVTLEVTPGAGCTARVR